MRAFIKLFPFFVLCLAAFFRLSDLDKYFGFYGDQGQDLLAVNRWLDGGSIPTVGILTSIGGFHMPPLYYYLIAPFVLLFGNDPISPVYLFSLSGLILIPLTYIFLLKFAGFNAAFLGSLLIAVSPHIIFISRGAYSPNLQIFCSVALLFSLLEFFKTGKYFFIFLTYFFIGMGLQFHYTFLSNLSVVTLLVLIFKREALFKPRFFMTSVLGFFTPLIPFLIGQIFLDFSDLKNILIFLTHPSPQTGFIFPDTLIDRLTFPFLIYFQTDQLPWILNFLVQPFLLIIFLGSFIISFTKNYLNYFTKIVITFFILGALHAIFAKLKFWWWYNDSYSISALFIITILISYLYQYAKIRFLWMIIFGIFVSWSFLSLPNVYQIGKSAQASKEITDIIVSDINNKPTLEKSMGIHAIHIVSGGEAFEYRYLLEKAGINTFSSSSIEDTDYIVVEKKDILPAKFNFDYKKVKLILIKNLYINDHSTIVKAAEIYRVSNATGK